MNKSKQGKWDAKTALKAFLYPFMRLDGFVLYSSSKERTIEMVFNSRKRTGGWIDRVKGMISCLEIARQTDRVLVIHTDDSFPIHKYFDAGSESVRLENGPIKWSLTQSAFHVSNDHKRNSFLNLTNAKTRHIFADTNLDYLTDLYPQETDEQINRRRATLFTKLFRLKPFFQQEVNACIPDNPIALHSRFTGLLGDFKDVVHRPLDEAKRKALLDICCKQALTLVDQNPGHPVILFSDSTTFLDTCCPLSPRIIRISGTPLHIDHTAAHDDALYKTLLDFFVMVHCDSIYLLLNKPMYNSNFSRYAAIFGNKKFTIYQP